MFNVRGKLHLGHRRRARNRPAEQGRACPSFPQQGGPAAASERPLPARGHSAIRPRQSPPGFLQLGHREAMSLLTRQVKRPLPPGAGASESRRKSSSRWKGRTRSLGRSCPPCGPQRRRGAGPLSCNCGFCKYAHGQKCKEALGLSWNRLVCWTRPRRCQA